MTNLPSTDIASLHNSIKAELKAKFPACEVDYYSRPGDKQKTPALLIEMDSFDSSENDSDTGTEQLPGVFRFNVYAVCSFHDGKKLDVRVLACNAAVFIRGKKWSEKVKRAVVNGIFPDEFKTSTGEYECMRVEFTHEGILGESAWNYEGEFPTETNVQVNGGNFETL